MKDPISNTKLEKDDYSSDLAISPTRGMLLLQLIPVSLRQIPKTSRKLTNLRAESLTVPRA